MTLHTLASALEAERNARLVAIEWPFTACHTPAVLKNLYPDEGVSKPGFPARMGCLNGQISIVIAAGCCLQQAVKDIHSWASVSGKPPKRGVTKRPPVVNTQLD